MRVSSKNFLPAASAVMLAVACSNNENAAVMAADRVFLNGAVYTVDAEKRWAEAVAVDDGRIVYVGDDAGAKAYIGDDTELLDLAG